MAYCLTVEGGKPLDITKLQGFERKNSGFISPDAYSLDEIDSFTSVYADEFAFREDLYNNGIIDEDDITKDITIVMKYGGEFVKLDSGLMYRDAFEYLDVNKLKGLILDRTMDITFLRRLLLKYRNSRGASSESLSLIRTILNDSYPYPMDLALVDFFNCEIYKREWNAGYRRYEIKISYKALHTLAMIVYSYDNKCDWEIDNHNEAARQEKLENLKAKLVKGYKPKTKEMKLGRTCKRTDEQLAGQTGELDGQMTMKEWRK